MAATNATGPSWPGRFLKPRDKSEDLPIIPGFALAPRTGRVRRMSEPIEDSIAMSGVLLRVAVCSILRAVRKTYPFTSSLQKVQNCNELLFDNNTCLMSACLRAVAQRVRVMTDPQIEWGGRVVSPSCFQYCKNQNINLLN